MDQNNGDNFLSSQDRHIWGLIYSTIERFECATIFRKTGPFAPMYRDCQLTFYVPRHHPKAEEVKAYLEHESKALLYVRRQSEDDWFPNTHTKVMLYSGLDGYLDRDASEEMAELAYDSLFQSLREELKNG